MLSEIGAENNSTTIVLLPSDFVTLSKELTRSIELKSKANNPVS
jgi:hypothetical protein